MPIGTDPSQFPGSRGYAELNFPIEEQAIVQFVFPSIPKAGQYRLIVKYNQLGVSRRPRMIISQPGIQGQYPARVSLHVNCEPPCHTIVVDSVNINEDAVFDLVQAPLVVDMTLEGINVLIDSIIAVPEEFFTADIPKGEQFIQECNVTTGMFRYSLHDA